MDQEDIIVDSTISPLAQLITQIVYSIVWILALFLAFRCNQGFDLFHFLAACCCPVCYLPYGIYCVFFSNRF